MTTPTQLKLLNTDEMEQKLKELIHRNQIMYTVYSSGLRWSQVFNVLKSNSFNYISFERIAHYAITYVEIDRLKYEVVHEYYPITSKKPRRLGRG